MAAKEEKYADKIAKLLRKAEDENISAEEAEAFLAGAQQLMTKYAIDEELIARARGTNLQQQEEKIVREEILLKGVFSQATMQIAYRIIRANGCKGVTTRGRGSDVTLAVIGYESDVARAQQLNASAQIQATSAMMKWWRTQDISYMSASEKFKARREFLFGFASGLGAQLDAAKKKGEQDAAESEADRSGGSAADATASVALVVKDKAAKVEDWMDEYYGRSLRTVNRRYSRGGLGSNSAGRQAGQRADVSGGRGRVAGNGQKVIGR